MTHYAPLVVWILVILGLGGQIGSMNETSRFIRPLLEFLFPSASVETLQMYHGFIRKAAHLSEYAILALLAVRAFAASSSQVLSKYRYILALLLVILIASTDEFKQSFEPSRTSSPLDSLLDIAGGIFALIAVYIVRKTRSRRIQK